ncbi:MAG TPA: hypothetical protein VM658_18250 [bacterium]|nr:hypothetical protein [bacterium]
MGASDKGKGQIKGTLLIDYIRLIRSTKNIDWERHLTPEDWELVNSRILSSNWYSSDAWQRIGRTLYQVGAKRDLNLIRTFGPMIMKGLLDVYKNILCQGDPKESIKKFEVLRRNFIRNVDADLKVSEMNENRVKVSLNVTDHDREIGDPEAFMYGVAGCLDELIKRSGGKNPTGDVVEVENGYEIELIWE